MISRQLEPYSLSQMLAIFFATSSLISFHSSPRVSTLCLESVVILKQCFAYTSFEMLVVFFILIYKDVDQQMCYITTLPNPKT